MVADNGPLYGFIDIPSKISRFQLQSSLTTLAMSTLYFWSIWCYFNGHFFCFSFKNKDISKYMFLCWPYFQCAMISLYFFLLLSCLYYFSSPLFLILPFFSLFSLSSVSLCLALSLSPREDDGARLISEQVSHHPPISAFHAESLVGDFVFHGSIYPKLKFWGKSVEAEPKGTITLELLKWVKSIQSNVIYHMCRIQQV